MHPRSGSGRASHDGDERHDVVAQLRRIERDEDGDGELALPGGTALRVSSLDKIFFPEPGYTKGDLLRYYAGVAPRILPLIADRPLVLKRYPDGVDGPSFFQQKAPDTLPEGVRAELVDTAEEGEQRRFVGGNLATLLYTVQLGAISVDPWNARVGSLDVADYAILDLDPGRGAAFADAVAVARLVKAELDRRALAATLKTSGKRGLHIMLPLPPRTSHDAALALAESIATSVAGAAPERATVERGVRARPKGTVYVDYLQNVRAKPVAAAWCVRPTPTATVSMPIAWEALDGALDPGKFTIGGSG